MSSYDFSALDSFIKTVRSSLSGFRNISVIPLPVSKYLIQNKRSSFVYSSSMRSLAQVNRKYAIYILCPQEKMIDIKSKLASVKIPSEIQLKLSVEKVKEVEKKPVFGKFNIKSNKQ